jgi:hypothetical protein
VIETFRAAGHSFVTPPPPIPLEADTVIDISHESLIRGWRRLRAWVEEEAESARVYRRLAETAALAVARTTVRRLGLALSCRVGQRDEVSRRQSCCA